MHAAHAIVSGMGGIRTAGDLVARLQLNRSMRIDAAKKHVAERLSVSVADLADPVIMSEVREDLNLGLVRYRPIVRGIEAKFNIARVLGININGLDVFKQKTGL